MTMPLPHQSFTGVAARKIGRAMRVADASLVEVEAREGASFCITAHSQQCFAFLRVSRDRQGNFMLQHEMVDVTGWQSVTRVQTEHHSWMEFSGWDPFDGYIGRPQRVVPMMPGAFKQDLLRLTKNTRRVLENTPGYRG